MSTNANQRQRRCVLGRRGSLGFGWREPGLGHSALGEQPCQELEEEGPEMELGGFRASRKQGLEGREGREGEGGGVGLAGPLRQARAPCEESRFYSK